MQALLQQIDFDCYRSATSAVVLTAKARIERCAA
jgi:hypothetical protein